METIDGGCLCGGVRFELEDAFERFHFCHCTQCQRSTGTAHAANLFTRPDNIHWLAGEHKLRRFDVPDRTISNAFCADCGAALPYLSKTGRLLVVPAGSLDRPSKTVLQGHIFWDERASWYDDGATVSRYSGFAD